MLGRGKIRAKARLALKAVKTSSEESGITATVAMPAPACIIVQVRRDLLLRRRDRSQRRQRPGVVPGLLPVERWFVCIPRQ